MDRKFNTNYRPCHSQDALHTMLDEGVGHRKCMKRSGAGVELAILVGVSNIARDARTRESRGRGGDVERRS